MLVEARTPERIVRKGYVDTAWGQVHYRTAGSAPGLPVVLFHQTASSSAMFEALMRELCSDYTMFAPDTPGFGESFRPDTPGTIPFYAEALGAALAALGVSRCFLFGHHTGASIAATLARMRPSSVEKLALSGPCALTQEAARDLAQRTLPMEIRADGSHLLEVWRRIEAKDAEAPVALRDREAVLTLGAGPRWIEGYHAVCEQAPDFLRILAELELPTLVMAGDQDTVFHLLEPSFRALRFGQRATLPGQTTYVCDRAPELVASQLRDFFR